MSQETKTALQQLKENVERGAALLDEKVPDWFEKIDTSSLSMTSSCNCVLGKLFQHYYSGRNVLFGVTVRNNVYTCQSHGFSCALKYLQGHDIGWEILDDLWLAEIRGRLLEKELSATLTEQDD